MRKFLLSAIALMMSVAMMAIGAGNGTSKANAIDFDWDSTYYPEKNVASWYSIKLSDLNKEAEDPTVALYLTNLTNETANVELTGNAVLKFPFPISMFVKDIDLLQYAGSNAVETYSIAGKKHVVWTLPTTYDLSSIDAGQAKDALEQLFGDLSQVSLIQLVEYGLGNVSLSIKPDQEIAVSADVYETEEIIDDACTNAVDFTWTGETVTAGEKWFYLDLNAVKNTDKKLNFVIENNGGVDANVAFDLYSDCPASAVLLDYDWTIPAGNEVKEALGRFFLDQMTRDYVYLKLTTDQTITLKAEEEVLPPPVELFNPSGAPVLEIGKEYSLNGETILKVELETLKAPLGYKTVCKIVNPNLTAVNLKQEIAFSTPVTSNNVQEKNLLVVEDTTLDISSKMIANVKSDVAYFRLTTVEALNLVIEYVKLETSKPVDPSTPSTPSTPAILAPSCEDSYAFDWNSSVKQKALMTKWYELDIASLVKNEEHVQLSFTNHHNAVVLVMGSILLDCNSTDTIPFICPVPAGKSISKVVDYSLLATSPLGKAYVSLTMMPTSAKSLADFASVRSQADLMNFVSMDFGAEIEIAAKRISALVDPSYCEATYQTLEKGVDYVLEPGKTQWYRVTGEFLKDLGLLEKLTIINNGKKDANVTFGVTVDCKYGIATTLTQTVPTWFDLTSYYPSGLYQLATALTDKEISEFYLSVKSDQPMLFGFGLDHGTMLGCDDAISFNWKKGATINRLDAQWFDFDLNDVKGTGNHLKLTFTNPSDEIVWVASMASLTCPLKAVVPTLIPVMPGMSVDKLIDYSFVAATPINNIYVAVIASGKLELGAALIDATVTEPADCINHVEVVSGEKYIHNPGTTWYKFSNTLLENMGETPRFTFENLSANAINLTAGVTVDCQYGILTKAKAKIPAQVFGQPIHNREFGIRIPREFFQLVRKFIDADVTELMLQLTADNPFAFSINMQEGNACADAQPFNWKGCYELQANQDVWYQVNVAELMESNKPISIALYNNNNFPVEVEAELAPSCPVLFSVTEYYTAPAADSVKVTVSAKMIQSLLGEYSKYINNNTNCYVRLRAKGDLTTCLDTVPPTSTEDSTCQNVLVEDTVVACKEYTWHGTTYTQSGTYTYKEHAANCDEAELLDWSKPIKLSEFTKPWYKLDVSEIITNESDFSLTLVNDLGATVQMPLELHYYCSEDGDGFIASDSHEIVEGTYTREIPYALFDEFIGPEYETIYLHNVNADCDRVEVLHLTIIKSETTTMPIEYATICEGETYDWRGNTYSVSDTIVVEEALECGKAIHTLKLDVINGDTVMPTEYMTICEGKTYEWRGNTYSVSDTIVVEEVLTCGTATYTLVLDVINGDTTIPTEATICEGKTYEWRGNLYNVADTYTETVVLECGTATYTLVLEVEDCSVTPPDPGCEDVATEFNVEACGSHTWNGNVYTISGDYKHNFITVDGCDSVVTMHLTILPANDSITNVFMCEGDNYTWAVDSVTYTGATNVAVAGQNEYGCEITYSLNIIIANGQTEKVTICDGPYVWEDINGNKHVLTESGIYPIDLGECSMILDLTIYQSEVVEETITACGSYTWHGVTYVKSGDYTYNSVTTDGCKLTEILHLTVNPAEDVEENWVICEGESYTWPVNGVTYTRDTTVTVEGQNEYGCDITYTLNLEVGGGTKVVTSCDSYTFNGVTYKESGIYTINVGECTVVLDLTIYKSSFDLVYEKACDSYEWHGKVYTKGGFYKYESLDGCSTEWLILSIDKTKTVEESVTVCELPYVWNGIVCDKAGDYIFDGEAANKCEVKILHLTVNCPVTPECKDVYTEFSTTFCGSFTWNGVVYTEAGDYVQTLSKTDGCDSIVTLHLTEDCVTPPTPEIPGNPCLDAIPFDWTTGAFLAAGEAQWYEMDITSLIENEQHLMLNFINHSDENAWINVVVALDCEGQMVPMMLPVLANMNVDQTIDYQILKRSPLKRIYVGVYTKEADIELKSAVRSAIATDQTPCLNATEVQYNETYVHEPGTSWYKVSVDLLKNNSDALGFYFANKGNKHAHVTVGMVADCQYTTGTTITLPIPTGLDFNVLAPNLLKVLMQEVESFEEKFNEWDVQEIYMEVTTDQTIEFALKAQDGNYACESAIDFDWVDWETNGIQLQADQDVWYRVNMEYPIEKLLREEEIVVAITNLDTVAVDVEMTVSPTCPVVVSVDKAFSVPARTAVKKTLSYADAMQWLARHDEYLPYDQIQLFVDKYGDYLSVAELKNMLNNYEKYISVEQLKQELAKHIDYIGYENVEAALNKYGKYIPYVDAEALLKKYEDELVIAAGYAVVVLKECDPYITAENFWQVVDYCKPYIPVEELKHLLEIVEKHLEDYTCYLRVKTTGDLYVGPKPLPIPCDDVLVEETVEACGQYEWKGVLYTVSGDYTFTQPLADPAEAEFLDWKQPIKLSEFTEPWYKVDVTEVIATHSDFTLLIENDLNETQEVTLALHDAMAEFLLSGSWKVATGVHPKTVTFEEFEQIVDPEHKVLYLHNVNYDCERTEVLHLTIKNCDETITAAVCDGTVYVDPITNVEHLISSLVPSTLTWTETVLTANKEKTTYTYVITPIVAPAALTAEVLATIPGATPVLTPGLMPNVAGTAEAIKAYYESIDTESVSDVVSVYWETAAVACGATSHTMTLFVEDDCDNVVKAEITLEVAAVEPVEETVTACDSYEWNGTTYTASGDYTYTTTNANGCDSVVILHLTINQSDIVEETVTACDSYEWHGTTYTTSGDYTFTTVAANGCDRIEILHLTINQSETVEETVTACDSYVWHGQTYTESNDYTFNTVAANGCDRTEILHLTINKSEVVEETVTACDSYEWHGQTYTESGDYTFNTVAANGCDRTEILHLTINQSETVEETVTACDSYVWHGQTYTTSGDYTFTTVAANGCDRTEILHLTINKSEVVEETVTACDSYEWNGQTYTESGDYTFNTVAANGCDRTEILHLTINKSETVEETITACDSYVWNGQTYTESGTYTYTTVAANGCDRIEILHLTINESEVGETTVAEICPGDSYSWNGENYDQAGTYTITMTNAAGCDSTATLVLSIPDPENSTDHAEIVAISKYGGRLLVLDLNVFTATLGFTPAPEQVKWYELIGDMDAAIDAWDQVGDDKFTGVSGYYYNLPSGDKVAGRYYALIEQDLETLPCSGIYRSVVLSAANTAKLPMLAPNVVSPEEDVRVLNLDSSSENAIRVYNMTGDLMATFNASYVDEFAFKAASFSGYYVVEIENAYEKVTLRYIVK